MLYSYYGLKIMKIKVIEYLIQGWFNDIYGWETVCIEDTKQEANQRIKEYTENDPQHKYRIFPITESE